MLNFSRDKKRKSNVLISISLLCFLAMTSWMSNVRGMNGVLMFLLESQMTPSKIGIKEWRRSLQEQCSAATTAEEVHAFVNVNKAVFTSPQQSKPPKLHEDERAVKRCKCVVMDFGANIGDTLAHVIDSGLVACDRSNDNNIKQKTPWPHFNAATKQFEDVSERNHLTHHLKDLILKDNAGPEDYCYYGIEGNPTFTERLQELEDYVMAIQPRPIQHMHFLTECVGAGQDGMTKLYLDTVNTDHNFWGSSIFKGHADVRKSSKNGAEVVAADVMGYTIGTLMKKTLLAFDPDASAQEKTANHLIVKVDIEGGEYPLLSEAVEDGTMCEFAKNGNKIDLFVEFHGKHITGEHEFAGKEGEWIEILRACGVNYQKLDMWWAR